MKSPLLNRLEAAYYRRKETRDPRADSRRLNLNWLSRLSFMEEL